LASQKSPWGSWGKDTAIRPPRDVDVYFLLPVAVYNRFQTYAWARQSALLQEVEAKLAITCPNTDMSGDGQVVVVNFGSYSVEVVPAFLLVQGGYWICDTNNGGTYKKTDPWAEVNQLEAADNANARNLRPQRRLFTRSRIDRQTTCATRTAPLPCMRSIATRKADRPDATKTRGAVVSGQTRAAPFSRTSHVSASSKAATTLEA
jgi:Second Messenger Oligonucleotide or Dinucleotide Synthetase domain